MSIKFQNDRSNITVINSVDMVAYKITITTDETRPVVLENRRSNIVPSLSVLLISLPNLDRFLEWQIVLPRVFQ
jgi:hypothetical protein